MADDFSSLLEKVINENKHNYGSSLYNKPRILNSLLADYSGTDFRKERHLLIWILEIDHINTLTKEMDYEKWIIEHADKLYSEYYIDRDKAISMLKIIFDVFLRDPYLQNRADYFFQSNEYDYADHVYDEILKYRSDSAFAFLGKGNIAVKKQRYGDVITYFEKAIEIEPHHKENVSKYLGIAYIDKGNRAKNEQAHRLAIDCFNKAIQYVPENKEKLEPILAEIY
ncbi:MAG: hypothetical protein LBF62_09465 [Tannerellaceae bacterium]|jgi:tetratricopeptide (TPR) repeat protein|nr:hypothetical protein [Tannerellaceae bacterium]